jgi:hypothetical protein
VTALTIAAGERPCVASKRFETNSNSAMVSRLVAWLIQRAERVAHLLTVQIEGERRIVFARDRHRSSPMVVVRFARRQQRQRHPLAALHGQLGHLQRIDISADARLSCFNEGRLARHGHRFPGSSMATSEC